jgi:PAS domain S-box-containing protein
MTLSYLKIRQRIRDLVSVFLAMIFITLGLGIYWDYQQKTGALFRESRSHVRIIAEHASRTFGEVDRVLDIAINKVLTPDKLTRINEKELYAAFLSAQKGIPQIVSMYFVDSKGILSASSLEYPIKKINLSDREYFRHHRDITGDTPFISRPYINRLTNKLNFVFSQRISASDGSFAGLVGASFEMNYFESLYGELLGDTFLNISLIREDGFPVVMFPSEDNLISLSVKNSSLFTKYLPHASNGVYREKDGDPNGSDQMIAFSRLPANYPLVARITYDWNTALALWKRDALVKTGLFVLFSALAVMLTRLLMRRLVELERSEEQRSLLNLIVSQSPVSVVVTDQEGVISYVNPCFSTLTGYSAEEAIGQNPRILKTEATSPETFQDMWAKLAVGQEWSGELCNKKKDGSLYWEMAHLFPIFDNSGAITHYAGVKENITERKQFEQEIFESRQQLADIIEFLPDATFVVDSDQRVIAWNRSMEEMTDTRKGEVLGQGSQVYTAPFFGDQFKIQFLDLLDCDDDQAAGFYSMFRRRGNIICAEVFAPYLYRGKGAHLWLTAAPLYNRSGERVGTIESVRDISEQKMVEEELKRSMMVAESSNQAKSDFIANMSHEIRTPMNAISGMAYLAMQTGLNKKQQDYIEKIISASNSLLGIINDILDYSKIEAGRLELESLHFSMSDLLDSVTSMVEVNAREKGLKLQSSIGADVPDVLVGDSLRLRQVLLNLVSNSVKFSHQGHVLLSVNSAQETSTGKRTRLVFAVTDTGIGMDEDQVEGIFAPFSQADTSVSRRFGGTGLGLAIVKRLVECMGGSITVVSRLGEGSTFSFVIECDTLSESSCIFSGDINVAGGQSESEIQQCLELIHRARILLVEDNYVNQVVASEMLKYLGMEVEVAGNGSDALKKLHDGELCYDLIFMDLQMPVMGGVEATRLIRAEFDAVALPIVAMTAHVMSEERADCIAAGMNDHLAKPVDPAELKAMLVKWIHPAHPGHTSDRSRRDVRGTETSPSTVQPADSAVIGDEILAEKLYELAGMLLLNKASAAGCFRDLKASLPDTPEREAVEKYIAGFDFKSALTTLLELSRTRGIILEVPK